MNHEAYMAVWYNLLTLVVMECDIAAEEARTGIYQPDADDEMDETCLEASMDYTRMGMAKKSVEKEEEAKLAKKGAETDEEGRNLGDGERAPDPRGEKTPGEASAGGRCIEREDVSQHDGHRETRKNRGNQIRPT